MFMPLFVIYSALALVPLSTTSLQLYTQNQSNPQQQLPLVHQQEASQQQEGSLDSRRTDEALPVSNSSSGNSNGTTTGASNEPQAVVSPSEQLQDLNGGQTPSPSFYYGDDEPRSNREENFKDDSDLNFNLMNAPHERIQAVKNLLNSQKNVQMIGQENKPQQYYQQQQQQSSQQATGNSMQCTHKGRQYLHGQSVPIEEQPCLNCTCRRAVLQCFLRVCPPIISLEAQRRMQQIVSMENGGSVQRCRMAKEPTQCCPSLRCEPDQKADNQTASNIALASSGSNRKSQYQTNQATKGGHTEAQNSGDASIVSLDNGGDLVKVKTTKEDEGAPMGYHNRSHVNQQHELSSADSSARQQVSSSQTTLATTNTSAQATNDEPDHLPRLTVINGATGQRDSILLITSNPSSHNNHHHHHHQQQHHQMNHSSERGMMQQNNIAGGHQDYAHALMEALLETVYSSAAQLNGLNLQGSCMINGSLYVEGSAVIPEGSAICQYCYCIRQKIMCVRPKCHLIISGCAPKYSNEFACCPTSYSCSNSESPTSSLAAAMGGSQTRLSLTDGLPQASTNQQNLSSRLWAALESAIGSHMPPTKQLSLTDAANLGATRSLNQETGASGSGGSLAINLLNSPGKLPESGAANNSDETTVIPLATNDNTTSATTSQATSVSASTQATTSTSTTTSSPMKPSEPMDQAAPTRVVYDHQPPVGQDQTLIGGRTRDNEASDESTADGESRASGSSGQNQADELSERAMDKGDLSERSAVALGTPGEVAEFDDRHQQQQFAYTANVTTEQPSSVSDFLEPMNRLGPLVASSSAPSGCVENNRQYAIGEQIPTLESCKHCYCGLEGLKECKMIECRLKVVHNCRPITPEGHCCPIRYECPPPIGHNDLMMATRNRYRSEEIPVAGGAGSQEQWMLPKVSSTPFGGPCKGDTGDSSGGEDCQEEGEEAGSTTSQPNESNSTDSGTIPAGSSRDSVDHHQSSSSSTGNDDDENPRDSSAPFKNTGSMDTATSLFAPETTTPSMMIETSTTNETMVGGSGENATSSGVLRNESVPLNLTEELNKFIMQIKQSGGSSPPSTVITTTTTVAAPKGTDYSLVTDPTSTSTTPTPTNETSQEMMINDQRSRMVDYHSVQAAPETTPSAIISSGQSSSPPAVIPKGMVGIPSIRVEPLNEQLTTTPDTRFATQETTGHQQQAGQRDSRSTSADGLDASNNHRHDRSNQLTLTPSDLVSSQVAPNADNTSSGDQANLANTGQDYSLDYRTATTGGAGLETGQTRAANLTYDTRSLELDPQSTEPHAATTQGSSTPNGAMVLFDDDLGMGDSGSNSAHHRAASLVPSAIVRPFSSQNDSELGATTPSSAPETTGDDINATTGSPFGMEAVRAPAEASAGWLHSLSGVVRSFGRRFTGSVPSSQEQASNSRIESHQYSDIAGATGGGSEGNHSSLDDKLSRLESSPQIHQHQTTARSRSTSLLDQLFKSVIGASVSEQDHQPTSVQEPQLGPLTMRPIVSSGGPGAVEEQPAVTANTVGSPRVQQHESPVEIVTAMEANEPEIFTQPSQIVPEVPVLGSRQPGVNGNRIGQAQSQFARRSDLPDGEDLMSMASTTIASVVAPQGYFAPNSQVATEFASNFAANSADAASQNGPSSVRLMGGGSFIGMVPRTSGSHTRPVQKALVCYEPATNRTYQPNEIIPKNDPCKTCTCVLGEELCQTLVCPEKPGENCKEERRPGECCANYLCGSNVSQSPMTSQTHHLSSLPPPSSSLPTSQPMLQPISVKPIFTHRPAAGSSRPASDLANQAPSNIMPSARLLLAPQDNMNNNNLARETGGRVMPNMVATQRAMNVDSAFGTLSNGLELQQRQSQAQQQLSPRPNQQLQQQNFINQLGQQNLQQQQQQHQPQIPMLQTQSLVGNRARIPIDNSARQRQQLPQHPIRTSELANLLPQHLRFRPTGLPSQAASLMGRPQANSLPAAAASTSVGQNMLNSMDNRNNILFNNAGQRIQPETMQANPLAWLRNDPTSSSNLPRGQQILPSALWGQFHSQRAQQVPSSSAIRPQVLMGPRGASGSPGTSNMGGHQQTRPSSDDLSSSMRRQPAPTQLTSSRPTTGGLSSTPLVGPSQNSNNVLMPRMSGQQVPLITNDDHNNLQHQSSAAVAASPSLLPIGDAGWQPNNVPVMIQSTTTLSPQATLLFKDPSTPMSLDSSQVAAAPVASSDRQTAESPLGGGGLGDKQRVLFDQHVKASIPTNTPAALSSNSVDTGFQPISSQASIETASTLMQTRNESLQTEEPPAMATELPLSTTTAGSSISSSLSPIIVPEVSSTSAKSGMDAGATIKFPDQFFQSTPQPSLSLNELRPLSSPSSETLPSEQPKEADWQSSASEQSAESPTIMATTQQEILPSSSSSSSTLPPAVTAEADAAITSSVTSTTTAPIPKTLNDTTGPNQPEEPKSSESTTDGNSGNGSTAGGEQTDDAGPASDFDPMAMFRVSECNIYGRIYGVGQAIEELSDVCKRCTCTQKGVDCQNKC